MNLPYPKRAAVPIRSSNRSTSGVRKLVFRPATFFLGATGIMGVHLLFADAMYSTMSRVLAGLLGVAAYYAILQMLRREGRDDLPFREFYSILFYVFFALPVFWEDELLLVNGTYVPSSEALDLALWAAILSLTFFYFFFPLGRKLGIAARPNLARLLPKNVSSKASGTFSLLVLVPVVMIITYSTSVESDFLPESILRVVLFSASAMLLLAVALRLGEMTKSPRYRIAALLLFVISSGIGLLSGMLESFLLPLAVVTSDRWLSSRRLPMLWVLMGLLLFLFLNPAKLEYRSAALSTSQALGRTLTVEERLDIWQEALSSSWGINNNIQANLVTSRARMADLLPVAQAIEYVPRRVPFANGEPWLAVPYSLIPRVLWPNKPDLTQISNGRYAVVFNRLTEEQSQITAFNLPQLADGYWNLGWFGVGIVGILAGLSVGFKSGAFDTKSWASCAIAIVFFINIRPQGDISSLLVGTLQTYLGAVLLLWILTTGERVIPPNLSPRLSRGHKSNSYAPVRQGQPIK